MSTNHRTQSHRPQPHKKKKRRKTRPLRTFARILAVLGSTLGILLLFVMLVMFVLFHGPSSEARKIFTLSLNETSALKWVPKVYLSEDTYNSIINPSEDTDDYTELPYAQAAAVSTGTTSYSDDSMGSESAGSNSEVSEGIQIIDVKGSTYKGKLMLVSDPTRVFFGSIDTFGDAGITLSQFLEKYNAIACTNAGGFEDEGGTGKGGIPDGIVIRDGTIVYGSPSTRYLGFAGFDSQGVLHVGDLTGQEALNLGVDNGTNFAGGPVLIKDGVRTHVNSSGINPRTAIGQTQDGTVILVSVEGRMADSLGASFEDMADIMEEYGAVNAVNMDGGSSAGLYYEGERLTRSCSVIGDRPLPTAILVSR